MPSGVPVATVALNGVKNAAILAVQILATNDDSLSEELDKYKEGLKQAVLSSVNEIKATYPNHFD
jgi:5-(carboxyamino)imidazole ribonucleotide mutase